jgi:hypothetical protein
MDADYPPAQTGTGADWRTLPFLIALMKDQRSRWRPAETDTASRNECNLLLPRCQ